MVAVAMTYYFSSTSFVSFIYYYCINQSINFIIICIILILLYKLQVQDKFCLFQKPTFIILYLPSLFFMLVVLCAFVLANYTVVGNKEYV